MKSKKKHAPLKKSLYEYISGRSYKPLSLKEIFQRLKLPKDLHLLGEKALNELVEEEKIYFKKDKVYPSTDSETIEGIIHIHPRGFGFVIPDDKKKSLVDVFIPRHLTKGAVHGDKVLASINPQSNSDKGPEGKVLSILNRGKKHLCGTVKEKIDDEDYLVHSPLFGSSKEIHVSAPKTKPLKLGDRVYVEILEWGEESDDPIYCKLKKLLGHISDPSIDVQAACLEYDLRVEFPKEVKAEAEKFSTTVTKKDLKEREDFSSDIAITIDPKTAKDFDDALSIRKDKNGRFHLGVHIADVAHYVQSGSELDREAVLRGNSTYFPGICVPMLPEELSNGLCSLKEGVKRLTISVLMQFDPSGHLQHFDIARSVIKSSKRFTYEEAKAILDGKKKSKFSPQLKLMEELCLLLKKRRYDRGGVDFALPDLFINLDKKGAPVSYEILEYDISHQLVEEFMLKSNEIVATHLVNQGKKLVFRIHEAPSSSDLETFYSLARVMGFNLPAQPSQQDIQTLFGLAKQTPHAHQLSIAFIRSMRLAYYSPNNVGHYGLALENYCHFTSPIRRYPDLIIQRLLFDHESIPHIEEIALKCSEKERLSFRAESSVTLLKKLRLLQLISEQEPDKLFEAKVSRVKPHGMYFELVPLMIEGFIHISKLGDDFFIYNPDQEILRGNLSGQTFGTGKQIFVKLISVDLIFLDTKWHLDQNSSWIAKPKRRSKKKSSRRPARKKRDDSYS